jgi:hypothetical protein
LELAFHRHYDENTQGKTVFSMGCGTLAKLDGTVPGSQFPDWQQGFGVLWKDNQPAVYLIQDGKCVIDGTKLTA